MLQNGKNNTSSKRKYYTLDFLNKCIQRDNATLNMDTSNMFNISQKLYNHKFA